MNFPYLLHPLVFGSLILTFVNDHFLKYHFQNFLTGKLSDLTGLFYFPFFLYALIEFFKNPTGQHKTIKMNLFIGCLVITDVLFFTFKYTPARDWLISSAAHISVHLKIVPDFSDLLCLLGQIGSYILAKRYVNIKQ